MVYRRLNKTKQQRVSRVYDVDRRLDIHVVPAMPRLEVLKELYEW